MADRTNVGAFAPRVGGGIFFGPTTAALPSSATEEITIGGDAFTDLGYITADGVTETVDGVGDGDAQTAWGGVVLRVMSDESATHTFAGALYELASPDAVRALYGDTNVDVTASGFTVSVNPSEIGTVTRSFVIDTIDKTSRKFQRIVIPEGTIYPSGDSQLVSTELNSVEFTIEARPSSDGVTAIKYVDLVSEDYEPEPEPDSPDDGDEEPTLGE